MNTTTADRRGARLAALLPASVLDRIDPAWELLAESPSAAALRVLATVGDDGWHEFVQPMTINWPGMLAWAREEYSSYDSQRVRIELAASLAGHADARPNLLLVMRRLDDGNRAVFTEALRMIDGEVTW